METYQVQVLTSLEELERVRALWEQSQNHPLATFEFFSLIARTRAQVRPCVVALLRDGEPFSLLAGRLEQVSRPVRLGYARLFSFSVWRVTFIAGGFLGNTSEESLRRMFSALDGLLHSTRAVLANFEQVGADSMFRRVIHEAFGSMRSANVEGLSRHWQLALPDSWESMMKSRGSKHRYWLNRLPRMLDRDFARAWEIRRYDRPGNCSEFVDAAESVARLTYHRVIGVGFSSSDEYIERVKLDATLGNLRGYVLFIRGEPRAFWYCVAHNEILHMMATAYDPMYRSYELGTILLLKIFQDHCGTRIRTVDFGLGDAVYKQRFATASILEGPAYVFSRSVRGMALRCLMGLEHALKQVASRTLEGLHLTEYVKRVWRRRLGSADPAAASRIVDRAEQS